MSLLRICRGVGLGVGAGTGQLKRMSGAMCRKRHLARCCAWSDNLIGPNQVMIPRIGPKLQVAAILPRFRTAFCSNYSI